MIWDFIETVDKITSARRYFLNGRRVDLQAFRVAESRCSYFSCFITTEEGHYWRHSKSGTVR